MTELGLFDSFKVKFPMSETAALPKSATLHRHHPALLLKTPVEPDAPDAAPGGCSDHPKIFPQATRRATGWGSSCPTPKRVTCAHYGPTRCSFAPPAAPRLRCQRRLRCPHRHLSRVISPRYRHPALDHDGRRVCSLLHRLAAQVSVALGHLRVAVAQYILNLI